MPDGNFPTVIYPNPEEQEAMSIGLEKAKAMHADLLIATDPDADRVGIGVKNLDGEYQLLNGNQTGALLVAYVLEAYSKKGLKGNEFVVKTIVTTELITDIAKNFGIELFDVLTGFKFIAGLIKENEGKKKYLVGGEESYGYLVSDLVRDKDAIQACAFIAEMVAYHKENGKTVFEALIELYLKYGFYKEGLHSITKKGKEGQEEIAQIMKNFRDNPPTEIAGEKLVLIKDYQTSESKNLKTGNNSIINLPKSNVLQFFTEKGTKISMRPSGTEPKIKFYIGVKGNLGSKNDFIRVENELNQKINTIFESLGV